MRPALSDTEKKIKGTYRPSRSTGKSVDPQTQSPPKRGRKKKLTTRENLCEDAIKLYDHAVQILTGYKLITDLDYHLITIMAKEYDTYIQMKDLPPIEYNPETGLSMVHASMRVKKIALDNFMKIAQQLNLTTAMRIKIKIKEESKEDDPLMKFLTQ